MTINTETITEAIPWWMGTDEELAAGMEEMWLFPEGNPSEDIQYIQKIFGEHILSHEFLRDMPDEEFMAMMKRAKRTEYCGKIWNWIIGIDGSLNKRAYVCGNWRYCDNCRRQRIAFYRGRLLHAIVEKRKVDDDDETRLRMYMADEAAMRPIRTSLGGSEHYLSLPQVSEDGKISVLFTDKEPDKYPGDDLTYDDICDLNWAELVDTPVRRRVSGKLGMKEKEDDERISVKSKSIVIKGEDADSIPLPEHIKEAYEAAIAAVMGSHEEIVLHSVSDIEDRITQLAIIFERKIKAVGKMHDHTYTVITKDWYIKAEIDLTCIAPWSAIQAKSATDIPWSGPSPPGVPF